MSYQVRGGRVMRKRPQIAQSELIARFEGVMRSSVDFDSLEDSLGRPATDREIDEILATEGLGPLAQSRIN